LISHPFLTTGAAPEGLRTTEVPGLPLFSRGKVRDMYDLGDRLLMISTDRLSAFDVVMNEPFPGKGIVLNALSEFWLERTRKVMPNHLLTTDLSELDLDAAWAERLTGRSMIVKKAERVDIECVVRGYLAGSGWAEYKKTGVCIGHTLPPGLVESSRLPEPIFTPATKEDTGHDINISTAQMADMVGSELTQKLEEASLALYGAAALHCEARGIILADTKFEFGILDGEVILIDEALTPDSSRFWPADQFRPGGAQPSFDKQYVRDNLDATGWNHEPPPPAIPGEVVERTMEKYRDAYHRIVAGDAGAPSTVGGGR
jgi:phosphoribosylaminoimidazole-succinocarboxamide synthase